MTVQEAIEYVVKEFCEGCKGSDEPQGDCKYCGLKVAIESMEKQIPKKPTHKTESHPISPTTVNFETVYQCRNCHSIVKEEWNFCTLCGQAIDWEEGGTSD